MAESIPKVDCIENSFLKSIMSFMGPKGSYRCVTMVFGNGSKRGNPKAFTLINILFRDFLNSQPNCPFLLSTRRLRGIREIHLCENTC